MEAMMASSKDAHKALQTLIAEVRKIGLGGRTRKRSGNAKALSESADQWVGTLERAAAEIPEWCDAFSIDVPPKQT
jgi:hypothetical protein